MAAEPPRYQVSGNERIRDRLSSLNNHAVAKGILADWVASMQSVFIRLEEQPESAGDPVRRFNNSV